MEIKGTVIVQASDYVDLINKCDMYEKAYKAVKQENEKLRAKEWQRDDGV